MGKANKQRRQAKQKARQHQAKQHQPGQGGGASFFAADSGGSSWTPPVAEQVSTLLRSALHALDHGRAAEADSVLQLVVQGPKFAGHERVVDRQFTGMAKGMITQAWRGGWQPVDLVRITGRRLGAGHVRLLCSAIADEMRAYAPRLIAPQWQEQLAELEANPWWPPERSYLESMPEYPTGRPELLLVLVELIHLTGYLPKVEVHLPIPGSAGAGVRATADRPDVDQRVLGRVRALLAKAESTQYPAEAETYTAAAQSLMARHSIDAALLAAATTGTGRAVQAGGRRVGIDNPYEGPKVTLLNCVASANRCRTVWSSELGFATLIGFEADMAAVEGLFTSLLVQATTAMNRAGQQSHAGARSRSRSFRQSFLTAYAVRIGERLTEATDDQVQAAAAQESGRNLLPVLASRAREVDETVDSMFPELVTRPSASVNDAAGWATGRGAADLASLTSSPAVPG